MAIEERQSGELKSQAQQDAVQQPESVDTSRRDFAKATIAASGVLLSLASRPVLGQWECQTPSGFHSGNLSSHGAAPMCSGENPTYYRDNPAQWVDTYKPGNCKNNTACTSIDDWSGGTQFNQVFSCVNHGLIYQGDTLMQAIVRDLNRLGAYIVAALLNANKGSTPVLSEVQVIGMFNEWDANGYFQPTAGVHWNEASIIAYLKTTMNL